MYENFYHEDIDSLSELEKAESLKNMLVSRATGGGADENSYNKLRKYLSLMKKLKEIADFESGKIDFEALLKNLQSRKRRLQKES